MMLHLKKVAYGFCLFLITLFPHITNAESTATITLSPKNPTPNSSVTLTLVSYSFNPNTAMVTWSSGGKELLSGLGEKKLTIQTGGVGETTQITVKSETASGESITQEITITPESVSLLYETPESYTPLFYEGRSLPSDGASVMFTAMPNMSEDGVAIPSNKIAYSWYINDSYIDSVSGINKQQAYLKLDYLSESTVVKVVARGPQDTTAEKSVTIYPHRVMPILYQYDELMGIDYTNAITKRFEAVKDFTLALEPFYLSNKGTLEGSAVYDWNLDGIPSTPLGGLLLSLRPKEESFGSRNLSISVSNPKRRLQAGDLSVDLVFDTRK